MEIVTDGEEPAEMIQVEGMLGWTAGSLCLEAAERLGGTRGLVEDGTSGALLRLPSL